MTQAPTITRPLHISQQAHCRVPFWSGQIRVRGGREQAKKPPQAHGPYMLAALSQQLSSEAIYAAAGALGVAGLTAAIVFGARAMEQPITEQSILEQPSTSAQEDVKRKDAVLVFGSTGKMGRHLTQQLLELNRSVVAAARNSDTASEKFGDQKLQSGQHDNGQTFSIEGGVDITNRETLEREDLWRGVSQVAIAVGPLFGRQADGQTGSIDNMTSERVDAEGVANIVAVAKDRLPSHRGQEAKLIVPMKGEEDLRGWQRVDDVIMGGRSSSKLEPSTSGKGAHWSGDLIVEGGGFCGTKVKGLELDMSEYDGVALRLKGDGQMYKVNLKTAEREDDPESTYAATFETSGDWETIRIPFREFVPVVRAKVDASAPPLDPSTIQEFGFRLSRFDFNSLANPRYKPGPFSLEIEGGIQGFKEPRPAVILVSSAATERNALIGDDAAARKRDIPIVQLNPGGILNFKYSGENTLRSSGLPYAVVRPVGLTKEREDEPFLLEASQGDKISGKISRAEAASVVVAALQTPASEGKTIEVRRSEAAGDQGKRSNAADLEGLFLAAVEDWHRPRRGLRPLPAVTPPPPPPSEERVKEILQDPQVQAAAKRDREAKARQTNGASANGSQLPSNGNGAGQISPKEEANELLSDGREGSRKGGQQETVASK